MAHHSENMEAGTKPVKSTGQCVFRVFTTFWRFPCFSASVPVLSVCSSFRGGCNVQKNGLTVLNVFHDVSL